MYIRKLYSPHIFIFSGMFFVLVLTFFAFSEGAQFPKKWTSCPKSGPMNECLKSAINFAVQDLAAGNPSLGVLPIDPMHFDSLSINQGGGPVSIFLDFIDMDVTGLKNVKIQKIENDWKNMEIKYTVPGTLKLEGKYKIKGNILLLPISGDGHFVITMENWKAVAKLKFVEKENGGKKFYDVDKFSFDFDVDKMNMKFDNLFNGDKLLGDNMNRFLNQNWREILKELKPSISKSFSAAYKEISNRIFSKLEMGVVSPE